MRATTKHLYLKLCKFDFVAWAFPTTLRYLYDYNSTVLVQDELLKVYSVHF